jgi:hypothetical protein
MKYTVSNFKQLTGVGKQPVVTKTVNALNEVRSDRNRLQLSLKTFLGVFAAFFVSILIVTAIASISLVIHGQALKSDIELFMKNIKETPSNQTSFSALNDSFQNTASASNAVLNDLDYNPAYHIARGIIDLSGKGQKIDEVLAIAKNALTKAQENPTIAADLLGFTKERTYVLAFQQNSQIKSLGGSAAQLVGINFNKGKFEMQSKGNTWNAFGFTDEMDYRAIQPPADMNKKDPNGKEQNYFESLYPLHTFRSILSQTLYPDFQVDGKVVKANWEKEHVDQKVSGVMAFDPVGLGYLMRGMDPIYLKKCDCTIEADGPKIISAKGVKNPHYDAAWYMLNGAYLDAAKQTGVADVATIGYWTDELFDEAEDAILDGIKDTDKLHLGGLIDGVLDIIHERRLLVTFMDEKEQALVSGDSPITNISGKMPNDDDTTVNVAAFFNDVEPSKIDSYLDFAVDVKKNLCIPGNSTYWDITVRQDTKKTWDPTKKEFTMDATKKEANSVEYIHSGNTIRTDFYVYGPQKAKFLGVKFIEKGTQSDLFKKGDDTNFGRYFARTRAYTNFTSNVHTYRYKADGLDFRNINVLATPDANGVKITSGWGLTCDDEKEADYTTEAVGQASSTNVVDSDTPPTTATK